MLAEVVLGATSSVWTWCVGGLGKKSGEEAAGKKNAFFPVFLSMFGLNQCRF
jgi:hypothetical protein